MTSERKIHEVYEWAHILNDLVSSALFAVGSFFFLYNTLHTAATFLFIAGSLQMMVGPMIRTANKLHVRTLKKEVIHW